jgi:hypothetical protein
MDIRTHRERVKQLPDVFYRYIFKDGKISKTQIKRNKGIDPLMCSSLVYFERPNCTRVYLSHAERIEIGKFDGRRNAVFLEEDNAEAEAAAIFDMHYNELIAECEDSVKDYILKRKTLYRIMRGEENGVGV